MKPIKISSSLTRRTIAGLAMVAVSSLSPAADTDVAAILKCKAMHDDAARLACYDALDSKEPATPPSAPVAPAAVPEVVPEVVPAAPESAPAVVKEATVTNETSPVLDDEVGRENMAPQGDDQFMVRGHVVSCRENVSGKLIFTFDNGQVWKQKDNKKARWRDCDFGVTIRKDFFGYVLKPDNNDKEVRISRVK